MRRCASNMITRLAHSSRDGFEFAPDGMPIMWLHYAATFGNLKNLPLRAAVNVLDWGGVYLCTVAVRRSRHVKYKELTIQLQQLIKLSGKTCCERRHVEPKATKSQDH